MCVWRGRKQDSIGLCQGHFALNGLLHLAALSPHAAGGPCCSACWEGPPDPLRGTKVYYVVLRLGFFDANMGLENQAVMQMMTADNPDD